jgi:hypothetical protein
VSVAPSGIVTFRPRTSSPFGSFTEIDARTSASLLNFARRRAWKALLQSQTVEVVVLVLVDVDVELVLLELLLLDEELEVEVLDVLEVLLVEDDVDDEVDDDVDELLVEDELVVVVVAMLVEVVVAIVVVVVADEMWRPSMSTRTSVISGVAHMGPPPWSNAQ